MLLCEHLRAFETLSYWTQIGRVKNNQRHQGYVYYSLMGGSFSFMFEKPLGVSLTL